MLSHPRLALLASFLMLALLLISPTSAVGIGGMLKSDSTSLKAGESSTFSLLLWSQEKQVIGLTADTPPGILVILQPEFLEVGPGIGQERVSINSGYAPAALAKVIVRNDGAVPGSHTVKIYARGLAGSGELSFSPVLVLSLKITIEGPNPSLTQVPQSTEAVVYEAYPAKEKEEQSLPFFWLVLVACILAASVIIYRYA